MAANVQSPLLVQVQGFLDDYVSKIPTYSTIGIALDVINSMSEQEGKSVQLPLVRGQRERQVHKYSGPVAVYSQAGFDWSGHAVAISALRSIVTYLALQALSYVSLCINGAVGCGKIALGFIVSPIDRERAQELLEEGLYQVLTAVYDYAIGQFGFICSVFSLIQGGSPEWAFDIHSKIFQTYKGAIIHSGDLPVEEESFCLLQRMADTLQEMLLPSNPQKIVDGIVNAVNGQSPLRMKKRDQAKRL